MLLLKVIYHIVTLHWLLTLFLLLFLCITKNDYSFIRPFLIYFNLIKLTLGL